MPPVVPDRNAPGQLARAPQEHGPLNGATRNFLPALITPVQERMENEKLITFTERPCGSRKNRGIV